MVPSVRRSQRITVPTATIIQSRQPSTREKEARKNRQDRATNSKAPEANLAHAPSICSENGQSFNAALVALGLPGAPKGFNEVKLRDEERWMIVVEKEKRKMEHFRVCGEVVDGEGNIVDHQARLVVDDGKQEEGRDFFTTEYAATLRLESLRILIAPTSTPPRMKKSISAEEEKVEKEIGPGDLYRIRETDDVNFALGMKVAAINKSDGLYHANGAGRGGSERVGVDQT
ncbi:hypothetical protein AAF712_001543 [Marasmius tenuissimus]|uniref:Uncharacterized protein n=1 Tax=Marasmius tenuissimus TaxID=585030 RepID=A0ABR3AE67_9AGAR